MFGCAIWSHQWYAQTGPGPDGNPAGGTRFANTGLWIGDYTALPENGGLGVFAHEYGHDLGLDHDSEGWWSVMADSRLSAKGDQGYATRAQDLSAWNKLELGWLDYKTVTAGQKRTLTLGPHRYNTAKPQAVVVVLPKRRSRSTSAGKKVLFRFHYVTDEFNSEGGFLGEDITLVVDGAEVFTDDAETDAGWRLSGWSAEDSTLTILTYGWDWVSKLAAQDIQFARGSHTPEIAVATKQKVIGIGGAGSLTAPPTAAVKWAVADGHPFMGWGQRAAILKDAKHLAAAKLYLNWQLSTPVQQNAFNGWSVRTDITPPNGLKPIWQYPNAHVDGFPRFMADRAEAERWRQTFALHFGEVKGDPTPGWLGLHPGQ